jgi:hypothetical protein
MFNFQRVGHIYEESPVSDSKFDLQYLLGVQEEHWKLNRFLFWIQPLLFLRNTS